MCFLYDNELGEVMYELGQNDYAYFVDLLWDLSRRGIGAAKVQPLIKIDYFEQFGNSKKLLRLSEMYYELFKAGEAKSIKKDKVANSPTMQQILSQYGNGNKKDGTCIFRPSESKETVGVSPPSREKQVQVHGRESTGVLFWKEMAKERFAKRSSACHLFRLESFSFAHGVISIDEDLVGTVLNPVQHSIC